MGSNLDMVALEAARVAFLHAGGPDAEPYQLACRLGVETYLSASGIQAELDGLRSTLKAIATSDVETAYMLRLIAREAVERMETP